MQINRISFGTSRNISLRDLRSDDEKRIEHNMVLRTSMDYLNLVNAQVFAMSRENDFEKRNDIRKDVNLLINKLLYNLQNIRNDNTKK